MPGLHRLIGTVLQDANLGDGVVNVILNAREDAPAIVKHLIANDSVRRVNFTGSTAVGRYVGEVAGKYLKPALLELGGKAPMIVLDDADLDSAVEAAAFGAFFNQGQICMSTERIIVDKAVADSFVAKLSAKAASLVTDDAQKNISNLGTMISSEAAKRVKKLLDDAVSKGAKLVVGGEIDGAVMSQPLLITSQNKWRSTAKNHLGQWWRLSEQVILRRRLLRRMTLCLAFLPQFLARMYRVRSDCETH